MRAVNRVKCICCLTAFLVTSLVGPGASALVYWTTQSGNVGRANLNGGAMETDWIDSNGRPTGIVVDVNYVYFTRSSGDTVARAEINGTALDEDWIPDTSVSGPSGAAVDDSYIYWADTDNFNIGRANLDGTSPSSTWITGGSSPTGIAVDSNYIYWTNLDDDTIGRANIDGTGVNDDFITSANFPYGIAVDDSYIYWTNYESSGYISRANLDGTGVTVSFISGVSNSVGMTVDDNYIYWTTTDDIGRANIDGTGASSAWIADVGSNIRGVAIDATATPVELVSFTARGRLADIKVRWETASEIDTAGFHIWRRSATEKDFHRVTVNLVPALGGPFLGATYSWMDTTVEQDTNYWYKLEDVSYSGISAFSTPVRAVIKKKK